MAVNPFKSALVMTLGPNTRKKIKKGGHKDKKALGKFDFEPRLGFAVFSRLRRKKKGESGVTGQDVKKETREAVQTATAFTQQQKEEYQKKLEAKLKEYDQKLDELKGRAEKMKEEVKGEINKEIEEFRKNQQAAAKKLEELKAASGKAWEDLKSGIDAALEEMEKTLEKAFSRFR